MSGPGQPRHPSNPMIESTQAQQIIEVLTALIDVLGQQHPASIVLQQARSEIVSLALSATPEAPAAPRRRRAA